MSTDYDPSEPAAVLPPEKTRDQKVIDALDLPKPKKSVHGRPERTTHAPKPLAICKRCGKEPRLPGSSRGQNCKNLYAEEVLHTRRLDERLGRTHT